MKALMVNMKLSTSSPWRRFKSFRQNYDIQIILTKVLTWTSMINFFTILNCSDKLVIISWKMVLSNFIYQQGDPNDRQLFFNFKVFHGGKKYWKYSIFDTDYSHISNNKSRKVSPSFGFPYWYKKLLHIIFQLSITNFSEQFKIVKKILIDAHVKTLIRIIWMS